VSLTITHELIATLKNPYRAHKLFRPKKLLGFIDYLTLQRNLGNAWETDGPFQRRSYRGYAEYSKHQAQKLQRAHLVEDLGAYDQRYRQVLAERLSDLDLLGKSVLCLAARIGTEVKAFRDRRAFAVGIDINPGKHNQYVLYGDFHDIKFPDCSVDIAFTNSLDHAFDIEKLVSEVGRILKPSGLFIVEAMIGLTSGKPPGFYESFYWATVDDLVNVIEKFGFRAKVRTRIDYPYDGEHLRFHLML
jgi:SAM-dependent methyltransferase